MMKRLQIQIRWLIIFFIAALFISGLTAIPIEWGLSVLLKSVESSSVLGEWLQQVYNGIHDMNQQYPFLHYGYDWLAFAHFVLAILFIGPLINPVKNRWVIEFGMIACVLIIPFALIAGSFRSIPFWWRLIDCSFGVIGFFPLLICYKKIKQLEKLKTE
jgi:hypothetical protein